MFVSSILTSNERQSVLAHVREQMRHGSPASVRDCCLMLLMLIEGLSVQEVCALNTGDLTALAPAGADQRVALHIRLDGRHAQERTLLLSADLSAALVRWQLARQGMSCRSRDPAQRHRLFLSNRSQPLSPRMAFYVVRTTLQGVLSREQQASKEHLGPQLLRNTAIVHWIEREKMSTDEACVRAGLKDAASLRWLRVHLSEPPPGS